MTRETGPKTVIPLHLLENEVVGLLAFLITSVAVILIFPLILALVCLRFIVQVTLRLRHGKDYGGLVASEDAIWAIKDQSLSNVAVLMVFESKLSTPEELYETLKDAVNEKIFKHSDEYVKITSLCKSFLGYTYYLKNHLTVDDCVRKYPVDNGKLFLDTEDVTDIVGKVCNLPMSGNSDALVEVLVLQKPLKPSSKGDKSNRYVVIWKIDHIVGDGVTLSNFVQDTFADDKEKLKEAVKQIMTRFDISKLKPKGDDFWSTLGKLVHWLKHVVVIYLNQVLTRDENLLHGPKLTGEKITVYTVEKEDEHLLDTVKEIRNATQGTTLTSVVLTAISRNLARYMEKYGAEVPDFISVGILALFSIPNLEKKPKPENKFSFAMVDLPMPKRTTSTANAVGRTEKYWDGVKRGPDYFVNYIIFKYIAGFIPIPILQTFLKPDRVTMTISNVPGVPKMSILGGQEIEHLIPFTPHRSTVGIGFSVVTYDNRVHLGLIVDKALIPSKRDAQVIVDGVMTELHDMRREVVESTRTIANESS